MPTKRPCDGLWGWRASRISWSIFVSLRTDDPHLNIDIVAAFRHTQRNHADTDDALWHALVHLESAVTRERDSPGHGMPGAPRVFFDLETRVLRVVTSRAFLTVV